MTSAQVVRWACDRCQRFWATEAELSGHRCVNVAAALEAAERLRSAEQAIKDRNRERLLSYGPVVHYLGPDGDPLYAELSAAKAALYEALSVEGVPA
jgi:hypothetical protein